MCTEGKKTGAVAAERVWRVSVHDISMTHTVDCLCSSLHPYCMGSVDKATVQQSDSHSTVNRVGIFRGIPQSLQLNLIITILVHNLARHDADVISNHTAGPQCHHGSH